MQVAFCYVPNPCDTHSPCHTYYWGSQNVKFLTVESTLRQWGHILLIDAAALLVVVTFAFYYKRRQIWEYVVFTPCGPVEQVPGWSNQDAAVMEFDCCCANSSQYCRS